jgi:hypothetical protein
MKDTNPRAVSKLVEADLTLCDMYLSNSCSAPEEIEVQSEISVEEERVCPS